MMCVEFHCCQLDCEVDKVLSVNVIDECAAIDTPPSSAIDCNIPHIHITIIYTYDIILTIEKKYRECDQSTREFRNCAHSTIFNKIVYVAAPFVSILLQTFCNSVMNESDFKKTYSYQTNKIDQRLKNTKTQSLHSTPKPPLTI